MKIVIVSDSHGNTLALREVLDREQDAEFIFHLGDGAADILAVQHAGRCPQAYVVRGNCDYAPGTPSERLCGFGGQLIFMTHGNGYEVKITTGALLSAARLKNADIALFGHTHEPYYGCHDGIYLFNPGALSRAVSGRLSYGVLTIAEGKPPIFAHKTL